MPDMQHPGTRDGQGDMAVHNPGVSLYGLQARGRGALPGFAPAVFQVLPAPAGLALIYSQPLSYPCFPRLSVLPFSYSFSQPVCQFACLFFFAVGPQIRQLKMSRTDIPGLVKVS